jgi:hypothetical protein
MRYKAVLKSCLSFILRRHKSAVVFFIFAVFFVMFFHKGIITGTFYTIGDQFVFLHPLRREAWKLISEGALPLWTPYFFSGFPLLAESHLGLAYPLTWGYLFLSGPWAEQINVLAPFLLAPIFTYLFVRALGKSRPAGIIAGFCFGYGGFMASWTTNGLISNAVMWAPLMLISILKASHRRFIPCLLGATAAYLMSVLNGTAQGFLWVGIIAAAYALYLSAIGTIKSYRSSLQPSKADMLRYWRPFAVACGSIVLSAGIAAFQIFESWQAKTLSLRNALGLERFNEMSYSPGRALAAFLAPIYNYIETTPFVPSIAAVFALIGAALVLNKSKRDPHVVFWVTVAAISGLLMLGANTPLYGLFYYIPIVNAFRGAARHSFEWTFALGVLAAYGWDATANYLKTKSDNTRAYRAFVAPASIFVATVIVGFLWVKDTPLRNVFTDGDVSSREAHYLIWKALFTSLACAGIPLCMRIGPTTLRTAGLCLWIFVACFFEPYINQTRWWGKYTLTADRMTRISPTARWLQQYSPEENRIYTRVRLLDGQIDPERLDIDAPNQPVLAGLHNVAGYEPMILQRYSRALGGVGMDGVTIQGAVVPSDSPLDMRSHALDLLNTRFLVTYSNMTIDRDELVEKGEIGFAKSDLPADLLKDGELSFGKASCEGDTLALVTTMADSAAIENGTPIARAEIRAANGQTIARDILAGVHTSEWAHERIDVRPVIRHALAPIFDTLPGDEQNSFPGHRYLAVIPLGQRYKIDEVTIKKIPNTAPIKVWKGSIYDSAAKNSVPLHAVGEKENVNKILDPSRWTEVHRTKDTVVFRNDRVMPRAWLVGDVKVAVAEEALKTITGQSNIEFDPRKTALIETDLESAPFLSQLPYGRFSPGASAKIISYGQNKLKIDTSADQPSFLVVSEINYPGWIALIDGREEPIFQTDYLLRGVALPAGKHTIEMKYTAPAFWKGMYVSLLTISILGSLAAYEFLARRRAISFAIGKLQSTKATCPESD